MKWPFWHPRAATEGVLPAEGRTYFAQVAGEYELLMHGATPSAPEVELRKIADAIVAKPPGEHTCADLFELEMCVVKLQPEAELRRRAWAIRAKYRDIAGDKEFEAYQASSPPDPKTAGVDELRADIARMLGEFHWVYAFRPVRERLRGRLAKLVFFLTLLLICVAGIVAYYYTPKGSTNPDKNGPDIPVLPIVIAVGMMGGYISLQRRIQAVPSTGDPIVNITELSNNQFSVYLAPISGAVFASLLYLIFIGGLLKGPLFPTASTVAGTCESLSDKGSNNQTHVEQPANTAPNEAPGGATDIQSQSTDQKTSKKEINSKAGCNPTLNFAAFVTHTGPASGVDFAILLVWAFIAGFAERFVPDTIDRLVAQASQK